MMKAVLLILLSTISITVYGQNIYGYEAGEVKAEKVIEAPGLSKDDLYSRVYQWFGSTFKNPEEVIKFNSQANGSIKGRYITEYKVMMNQVPFYHDIDIYLKEGKYRVIITRIVNTSGVNMTDYIYKKTGELKGGTKGLQDQLNQELTGMIASIEKAVISTTAKNEW